MLTRGPVVVVDEEIYHRPPSMMIATVDKFAMMAWRGETRTLFGRATNECPRHGLLWPEASCNHPHGAVAVDESADNSTGQAAGSHHSGRISPH